LESTNIPITRPSRKLASKRYGPMTIIEQLGSSYRLKLYDKWKLIHPVVHESYLTPYVKPKYDIQRKRPPPPPVAVGSELEYEVDKILDSRKFHGKLKYLIRWKGYTEEEEEDSWEPKRNIHAKELVRAFHKCYPMKDK
jgi:hypothetical protein